VLSRLIASDGMISLILSDLDFKMSLKIVETGSIDLSASKIRSISPYPITQRIDPWSGGSLPMQRPFSTVIICPSGKIER
jgi:hypothetical protein